MDSEETRKSLRTAKQLHAAFIDAKDQDHDSAYEPEEAPDGTASFTLYQMVGGDRRGSRPQGQWVTKVTVASEWVPFTED